MASQSYRNRQEEQKNKKPTLEMRSLKRFEKMKFANLHLERQYRSEMTSLHMNQERKLLDLRHDRHGLMNELQANQYRLLSSKLTQKEQERIEEEKATKEAEEQALKEKQAIAAKKDANRPKSVMFTMDWSDSDSDVGYESSDDEMNRGWSGTKRSATHGSLFPPSSGFSRGAPSKMSFDRTRSGLGSSASALSVNIRKQERNLKREMSANPVLKGFCFEADKNLNAHADGAMNLATRRLEKTRRSSMPPLVGHLPYRDRVEMLKVIQARRRKSAPSKVGRTRGPSLHVDKPRSSTYRPLSVATADQALSNKAKSVPISTMNPGDQKIYVPKTLKEKNSSGDGQERQRFMKLRKQQEVRMYNEILKRVDEFVLGTSTPKKANAHALQVDSEDMNPTEEALLKNMNKFMLVAKMVGVAKRFKKSAGKADVGSVEPAT